MEDGLDVIADFVDGEPVDPVCLTEALADESGRIYLIDLLVIRRLVGGRLGLRDVPAQASSVVTTRRIRRRWIPAAAAVFTCLLVGYAVGRRTTEQRLSGLALTPPVEAAPAATQVIRLRRGVDWSEAAGGQ